MSIVNMVSFNVIFTFVNTQSVSELAAMLVLVMHVEVMG